MLSTYLKMRFIYSHHLQFIHLEDVSAIEDSESKLLDIYKVR